MPRKYTSRAATGETGWRPDQGSFGWCGGRDSRDNEKVEPVGFDSVCLEEVVSFSKLRNTGSFRNGFGEKMRSFWDVLGSRCPKNIQSA